MHNTFVTFLPITSKTPEASSKSVLPRARRPCPPRSSPSCFAPRPLSRSPSAAATLSFLFLLSCCLPQERSVAPDGLPPGGCPRPFAPPHLLRLRLSRAPSAAATLGLLLLPSRCLPPCLPSALAVLRSLLPRLPLLLALAALRFFVAFCLGRTSGPILL